MTRNFPSLIYVTPCDDVEIPIAGDKSFPARVGGRVFFTLQNFAALFDRLKNEECVGMCFPMKSVWDSKFIFAEKLNFNVRIFPNER